MAEQPIKGEQVVEKGIFDNLQKETQEELDKLIQMDKVLKSVAKNAKAASKAFKSSNAGDLQKTINEEKKLTTALVEQEKVKRAKISTEKALISLTAAKERAKAKEIKQQKQLTDAYKRESKELNDLRHAYKNLAAQGKQNSKQAKQYLKDITRLDTKLKKIDKTVGQSQRNVGNYRGGMQKLGSSLKSVGLQFVALTTIIYGIGRAISNSVKTFSEFQQGNANLASVLGKSRKEIKALTKDAKRLGSSTAFTASEVTKLQVAFSKLGFSEEDILKVTGATLALAAATGTDLNEAATVTAQTMNGFGLEADETQRVVDVMAKSFTTSALDMQKFSAAMANVAPVAKIAGFSIEKTTAILGTLVDSGIDASKAGTDLRNIFQSLAKEGLTMEQAMDKIRNSTDKITTATDLFGKRSAAAGIIMADNNEHLIEMEEGLINAGGAAQEMADTQLDTLQGSVTKLSSAWEGFILSLESGDGVLSKVLRDAIDLATEFVGIMTFLASSNADLQDKKVAVSAETGTKAAQQQIQEIAELQELSDRELEMMKDTNKTAKFLLNARNNDIKDAGEQRLLFFAAQSNLMTKQVDEMQETFDEKNAENDFFGVNKLEDDIATFSAMVDQYDGQLKTLIQNKSVQELKEISKSTTLTATDFGRDVMKLAQFELQRRKDIGEEIDAQIGSGSGGGGGGKGLTGLALLQQELNELEKKRSDYLVENGGEIDLQYITMTNQTTELKEQITLYKSILKGVGDIEKAEKRDSSIGGGTSDIDRSSVDLTTVGNDEKVKKTKKNAVDLKGVMENLSALTTTLTERRIAELDRLNEAEQKKFEQSMSREQEIIAMRNNGAANVAESLAFEREAQAKALAEQERIARKKQRLELINSGLSILNNNIQQGDSNAVGTTLSDITALIAGLSSLPAFWTGTETTVGDSVGNMFSNGRDGILARVDKDEMILNKDKSDSLKNAGLITTDKVVQSALAYQMGTFDKRNTNVTQSFVNFDDSRMTSELTEIKSELKALNGKPTSQMSIKTLANVATITEKISQGNSSITKKKHIRLGR